MQTKEEKTKTKGKTQQFWHWPTWMWRVHQGLRRRTTTITTTARTTTTANTATTKLWTLFKFYVEYEPQNKRI